MILTNETITRLEPMLRKLARQYHTTFLEEDDLIQEAWLALMELPSPTSPQQGESEGAFVSLPPTGGTEGGLLSYARKAMQEAINRHEYPVRLPAHPLLEDEQTPERLDIAPDGQPLPIIDQSVSIEDLLTCEQMEHELYKAIRQLPNFQRLVIRRLLAGDSYEKIAQTIGATTKATYDLRDRAVENIKKMLSLPRKIEKKVV